MLNTLHLRQNFDGWFSAVPGRLYANRDLTAIDRDVFGVILLVGRGKAAWVEIRQSEIAEFLRLSERAVKRAIGKLRECGEITAKRSRLAGNAYWVVKPATGRVKAETSVRPFVASVLCSQCLRPVRAVGKAGACRSCVAAADLSRKVADARRELGMSATPEQIAAHLKNGRLAAKIRRLIEVAA